MESTQMDWPRFVKKLMLAEGRITEVEAELLERAIDLEGSVELDEVAFLVALKREAVWVHPRYDKFLFGVLKQVVLHDGKISDAEAEFIRKLILADRQITETEAEFVRQLEKEAKSYGPQFVKLFEMCTKLCHAEMAR
jgi:uncharacterized tellurite resistance protein B-like protein